MDDTDNTGRSTITKSELIEQLTIDQLHLDPKDVRFQSTRFSIGSVDP